MDMKTIDLKGISYITKLEGTEKWYWGSDYVHGDLYEAEEVYGTGEEVKCNRLVLVKYPEGRVIEPVKLDRGQYFGNAAFERNQIVILYVDFIEGKIILKSFDCESEEVRTLAELKRSEIHSCYGLMLQTNPLFLSCDENDCKFQILWPEQAEFEIEKTETLHTREGDILIFSAWVEDPDYREEMIVRKYPTGEIVERQNGTIMDMPDGQRWLLV